MWADGPIKVVDYSDYSVLHNGHAVRQRRITSDKAPRGDFL